MNILALDIAGIYVEQCNDLWRKGDTIKYYTSYEADQKFNYFATGLNFGHLEKVYYPADWYEWADLIFSPNCIGQDEVAFLRRQFPKKSIFGSGETAKLEQDRWGLKKVLK